MESMAGDIVPDPRIPCNDGMDRVMTEHGRQLPENCTSSKRSDGARTGE